jgi:hypothetical protein
MARAIIDFGDPQKPVWAAPSPPVHPAVLAARRKEAKLQELPRNREPSGVEDLSLPPLAYSGPREVS